MPAGRPSLSVLGDLLVEITARTGVVFGTLVRDTLSYQPITMVVGGTGANLARAAAQHFDEVRLLGRVGDDPFGVSISAVLAGAGVHSYVEIAPQVSTGIAVYIRDSSPATEKGIRLLLIDRGANGCLDAAYIEKHAEAIGSSDVFFLDG